MWFTIIYDLPHLVLVFVTFIVIILLVSFSATIFIYVLTYKVVINVSIKFVSKSVEIDDKIKIIKYVIRYL